MDIPLADTPPVDEFAQTRGGDDLFDDEIIPIYQEGQSEELPAAVHAEENATPSPNNASENSLPAKRGRGTHRVAQHGGERAHGRGKGRGGRGGRSTQDKADSPTPRESSVDAPENQQIAELSNNKTDDTTDNETSDKTPATASSSPPAKAETPRVQAVRGDRSGTGGVKKPKLTEEELAERMAAAKINAAKVAAAHARAEADEASFQEREKVAAEKRRQEYVNRRAMDGEREKNRLRKLGAQTGREWDAEKREEDFADRRGGPQYRRGMHGSIEAHSRSGTENGDADLDRDGDFASHGRGRGGPRGGRGGRGGRGRGRGGPRAGREPTSNRDGRESNQQAGSQSALGIDNESEFPALPGKRNEEIKQTSVETQLGSLETIPVFPASPGSPAVGTWAEQVESSSK